MRPIWPVGRQLRAHRAVDVGSAQLGRRAHNLRLLTSEGAHNVHRVATRVHQRATREVVLEADVREPRQREAQRGLDVAQRAELTAADDLDHPPGERVVAPMEGLHEDETGLPRNRRELFRLRSIRGERLLAQHVLAGLERSRGPRRVQTVRQRVVDRVDVGRADQRLVIGIHVRHAVLGRELLGPRSVSRRDRDDLGLPHMGRRLDHRRGRNARRTEHTDPHDIHHATLRPMISAPPHGLTVQHVDSKQVTRWPV